MIRISSEHQDFIDAQVASGAFGAPDEVVSKAIELLRGAVDANLIASIDSIREGIADELAGRVKALDEVAAGIREQLKARQ